MHISRILAKSRFKFIAKSVLYASLSVIALGACSSREARADFAKTDTGCMVEIDSKSPVNKNQPVQWSGACTNGYASGPGTVVYNYTAPIEVKTCQGEMRRGKLEGKQRCEMNNGNTFTGTIKNDQIVGQASYTWKSDKCPECFKSYTGTYVGPQMARGQLRLVNGTNIKLHYAKTDKNCLVWNEDPQPGEIISWSGACNKGLASGKGLIKITAPDHTEITKTKMVNGMMEGKTSSSFTYKRHCPNCVARFEGMLVHNEPIQGKIAMGDGRTMNFDKRSSGTDMIAEMKKLASDSMKFDLAVMQIQQQMARSQAMANTANMASCYMSGTCTMVQSYELVPTY